MAHFLFPVSDSVDQPRRKTDYLFLLEDFVRGSIDSINALNLFHDLVTEQHNSPDSAGFLAFDPHVGDTGCQLRVRMFLEVFDKFKLMHRNSPENWEKVVTSLNTTILRLEALVRKARKTYFELTMKTVPKDLGLGSTKGSLATSFGNSAGLMIDICFSRNLFQMVLVGTVGLLKWCLDPDAALKIVNIAFLGTAGTSLICLSY
ncbi:hypothetical protein F4820DRAFT_465099 [Hypoxylon rubiginosum]|uniref:Uncharacterized protein n=1 Tax=Hypoxylon rubiginosum TaxID=110542 RepID=A0ACB9YPZ2_9PEZI|nr:hypothetical protein F4820DRAFT_465099 [Hypoxylon rubiginosum]